MLTSTMDKQRGGAEDGGAQHGGARGGGPGGQERRVGERREERRSGAARGREAAARAREAAQEAVIARAMETLTRAGGPVSAAAVARQAGVAREAVERSAHLGEIRARGAQTQHLRSPHAAPEVLTEARWRAQLQEQERRISALQRLLDEARTQLALAQEDAAPAG